MMSGNQKETGYFLHCSLLTVYCSDRRKMIRFDYHEPTTLKKAFALMERHGDDARVIAGGTSMIIMMRQRLLTPKVVISLARHPETRPNHLQRQRRPAYRRRCAASRH